MISVATLPFRTISIGMNRVCKEKAKELKDSAEGEIELAKAAYYFVRDEIKHSWDVQDPIKGKWHSCRNMLSKAYVRQYA